MACTSEGLGLIPLCTPFFSGSSIAGGSAVYAYRQIELSLVRVEAFDVHTENMSWWVG